jgi:hypothetical protein
VEFELKALRKKEIYALKDAKKFYEGNLPLE